MRCTLFFLLFIFKCSLTFSQNSLKGVVLDAESNKPVPYVSIGITDKPNGTVSNAEGEFKIDLDTKVNNNDTLKFSSVGYQSKAFLVAELRDKFKGGPLNISLEKAVKELKQVTINAKRVNVKILGYETVSKLLGLGFGSNSIGSQAGVRIPIKHPNTNIENLSFFIIQNSFERLTLRVNIYEMKDGKPGDNILTENIIYKVEHKQTGKITIDLSQYNINVDKDVLITLEWIEAQSATDSTFSVSAVLFGSTYFRQASEYLWKKKGPGVGFSVKANY